VVEFHRDSCASAAVEVEKVDIQAVLGGIVVG